MVESVLVMLSPAFCDFGWCVAQAALTVTKLARKDWNIKFKKKHLRMQQITLFQDKKSKNFLGRGHSSMLAPSALATRRLRRLI